jgi:hypothetical protein
MLINLDVSFYSSFLKPVLDCSFCESMAGSLSVASTAVSSAKAAVVDSGEVGRSAVYSRYNNGPRTLCCGKHTLTGESSEYSVSTFMRRKYEWTMINMFTKMIMKMMMVIIYYESQMYFHIVFLGLT